MHRMRTLFAAFVAALTIAAPAQAGGGHYTVDGGTALQQAQVKLALDASAFNWSVVPQTIQIHVVQGSASDALPGVINLSADWLDWGPYAWGIVQHEYAHQVDFLVLTDSQRTEATKLLGGDRWAYDGELTHESYTAERFASLLSWTFWPNIGSAEAPLVDKDTRAALASAGTARAFQSMLARWGLAKAPAPVCRTVKVKRGHYVWVRVKGKRVHRWIKPVYRKVCSS